MKKAGGTIGGSIQSVPVALASTVALTTPGFGGNVYFPTGKGWNTILRFYRWLEPWFNKP